MSRFEELQARLEELSPIPVNMPKLYLLGDTGAGKTTIVRKILGTEELKFPSVQQKRTTVAVTEYVGSVLQPHRGNTLATQNSKLTGKIMTKLRYLFVLWCVAYIGGAQAEEVLSASVREVLQRSVSDQAAHKLSFGRQDETDKWLKEMSLRLQKRIPDSKYRTEFLNTVRYEAIRAGLDPELVLGVIEVKSGFNQRAVSPAGAKGYMQVMPFWVKAIGNSNHDLFNPRTNLRYGCTILRHYLDVEKGDLYRALGHYDGSLGKPYFPNLVHAAWKGNWALLNHK